MRLARVAAARPTACRVPCRGSDRSSWAAAAMFSEDEIVVARTGGSRREFHAEPVRQRAVQHVVGRSAKLRRCDIPLDRMSVAGDLRNQMKPGTRRGAPAVAVYELRSGTPQGDRMT